MTTPVEGFSTLTAEEMEVLIQVPIWITALIGGADGRLDPTERAWAEHIVRIRTYGREDSFDAYYHLVAENFSERLKKLWQQLPADASSRNEWLSEQIAQANAILSKLDNTLAATLYHSYLRLAKEVAKASGGFLRMGAISPEENRWLKLPMLLPISSEESALFSPWEDDDEDKPR